MGYIYRSCGLVLLAVSLSASLAAQDPTEERLRKLEEEHRQLLERLDMMGQELERSVFQDVIPTIGESRFGLGPAASKVYGQESGISLGGYGEFLFEQRSGDTDRFDALRVVTYIGYKFDERWVFNSEIEVEHGTTSASSGTTSSGGSVSAEFAYIDYLYSEAFNPRGGLVLAPMGLINEMHEPTTFLTARRPQTEQRIIPTTWRAMGAGVLGEAGDFAYRGYAINSLNGEEFDSSGLRGGRQKGNRTAADDIAFSGRLDYAGLPGVLVGGSVFYGQTGQDGLDGGGNPIPEMDTFIFDVHAEVWAGPWSFRGLYSYAHVNDAAAFNTSTGENLAEGMEGYYLQAGFEVLAGFGAETDVSLTPYVQYEHIDTQETMPAGFVADPTKEDDIWTFGINFKPIDQIVLKLDYEAWDKGDDQFNILFGYVF